MAGRDITEGRGDSGGYARAIAVDVGIVSSNTTWTNTDVAYDVAIGGMPFIYAINDQRQYARQTAPFRKDQFDNGSEPGEQSLTGWWIRSQSSFHAGDGIRFYDTTSGENYNYRFADSKGVDVWTKGQVTLLPAVTNTHYTSGPIRSTGTSFQKIMSVKYSGTNAVLLWDEYDVDKITTSGFADHFIDYNAGTDYPVYAICNDGVNAYWVTRILDTGVDKTAVYSKPLTGNGSTSATQLFKDSSIVVSKGVMEYVKDRIVMAINNKIYEFSSSAAALPTALYTHSDTDVVFTSITASGPAIYIAGYSGIQSFIYKFTLNTSGVMPTLTTAITAAEMPVGEIIHKIYYYLGYMMIGTSKGVRAAVVSEQDGSIKYGPLIVETSQPVYDFSARNSFIWCATGVGENPGLIRINLGEQIEPLVFAYANDLYDDVYTGLKTTACGFVGDSDVQIFCTAANNAGTITNKALTSNVATLTTSAAHGLAVGDSIWVEGVDATFNGKYTVTAVPTTTTFTYAKTAANVASTVVSSATALVNKTGVISIEDSSNLRTSGYLTTGAIRYGTLEPKNFKRLLGRGDFTYGSMTLETVDKNGTEYDHISYDATVGSPEVTTTQPQSAQEFVSYKFILFRDATTTSLGPIFKGYQAKATIATPRQRVIQFPVYCYDLETDRFNVTIGYEGRAYDRIRTLEEIEEDGDVVTWQDLNTGEQREAVIERVTFVRGTPPDKGFSGFGGILEITIRTV